MDRIKKSAPHRDDMNNRSHDRIFHTGTHMDRQISEIAEKQTENAAGVTLSFCQAGSAIHRQA